MNRRKILTGLLAEIGGSGWHWAASRVAANEPGPLELEVIASSVQDAVTAYEGGAARLELAVQLERGGVTPPREMIQEIIRRVPIPARVMLRLNEGFELRGQDELVKLVSQEHVLTQLGIDGFITGYIKAGKLDLDTLQALVAAAPSTRFTIHNAIEMTSTPLDGFRALRAFSAVDRALVTGGGGPPAERAARLRSYQAAFGPGRSLVLGGLRLEDIPRLRPLTDATTYHVGIAVRTPETPGGKVDINKVRKARQLLR